MIYWENACELDKELFFIIAQLLKKHSYLLNFIFDAKKPRLKASSSEIMEWAEELSSGENLLIRLALDIWDGSGNVLLLEICKNLDEQNFNSILTTIKYLR